MMDKIRYFYQKDLYTSTNVHSALCEDSHDCFDSLISISIGLATPRPTVHEPIAFYEMN